jgi:Arc/MetJ family transcription regulator
MTQISLNDELIGEVMTVGHYHDAKEAVVSILTNYLKQHKALTLFDELRLPTEHADDGLVVLFERNPDMGRGVDL